MKLILILFLICTQAMALSQDDAKHLMNRTIGYFDFDLYKDIKQMNRKEAAEFLVNKNLDCHFNELDWIPTLNKALDIMAKNQKKGLPNKKLRGKIEKQIQEIREITTLDLPSLRYSSKKEFNRSARQMFRHLNQDFMAWRVEQNIRSKTPLCENVASFWENHFTTSLQQIKNPSLFYLREKTIYKYAMGDFGKLLKDITLDPSMLLYLDGFKNTKKAPNENYAREVMELFTLGAGNYTEKDIREAARALTGYKVRRYKRKVVFRKKHHDQEKKTIFGKTGNYNTEQFLDLILERDQTSIFITKKMLKHFIGNSDNEKLVKNLSKSFKESKYNISTLVSGILTSDEFYHPRHRGMIIKSPLELVSGLINQYGIDYDVTMPFIQYLRQTGQTPLSPPDVKGYRDGKSWITSNTLLVRRKALDRIAQKLTDISPRRLKRSLAPNQYLLSLAPSQKKPNSIKNGMEPIKSQIIQTIQDPVFQLK